ncbi:MAG: C-GCAxxG-C-C family protein [Chloroflexia bacterium]
MARVEQALALFEAGANCAQAVLYVFAPAYGLEPGLAMRIAAPFGGGMARTGEVCGALSGGLMVIGLHCGPDRPAEEGRDRCYELTRTFLRRFQESYGSLLCRELLGCEILTAEGQKYAHESGRIRERCPRFVRRAVELLEDIL